MLVNRVDLLKFLELLNVTGEVEVKEAVIIGDSKSLKVLASTLSKVLILNGEWYGDFSDIGTIGIDDISLFKKIVSTMKNKEILIVKKDNKLVISESDRITASLILRNTEYILTNISEEIFTRVSNKALGNEFELAVDSIKEILSYYTLASANLELNCKDSVLSTKFAKSENEIQLNFKLSNTVEDFSVKLNNTFIDCLSLANDKVMLSTKNSAPIFVKIESDICKFNYVINAVTIGNE